MLSELGISHYQSLADLVRCIIKEYIVTGDVSLFSQGIPDYDPGRRDYAVKSTVRYFFTRQLVLHYSPNASPDRFKKDPPSLHAGVTTIDPYGEDDYSQSPAKSAYVPPVRDRVLTDTVTVIGLPETMPEIDQRMWNPKRTGLAFQTQLNASVSVLKFQCWLLFPMPRLSLVEEPALHPNRIASSMSRCLP